MRLHLTLAAALACARAAPQPKECVAMPTAQATRPIGASRGLTTSGRGLAPMGESIGVGQSPQNLAVSPDGTVAVTAEFGVNLRGLSVIGLRGPLALVQQPVQSRSGGYLRGLAFSPDGKTLYAANTGNHTVEAWDLGAQTHRDIQIQGDWPADLALSADGATLFVAAAISATVEAYEAHSGALLAKAPSGGIYPQALLLDESGQTLYVANEGAPAGRRNRLNAFDAQTLAQTASYEVGKNPAALALDAKARLLYVAASDGDWIDRIDLDAKAALTPIPLVQPGLEDRPYPGLSVQPNALALSADGARLYVSAAMLDAVLVVDTLQAVQIGAIPTGFRPTAVVVAGGALLVANAKGNGTLPESSVAGDDSDLPRGTVERIAPIPDGAALADATAQVQELNLLPTGDYGQACEPSLANIRHVIYVLKENKTFDAYFGDFPGAEASRDFLEWGEQITPNQHALARQFCLLDNFYVESEQSVEGHFWATAQTTTDYFERTWAAPWGGHAIAPMPLPPGGLTPLDSPPNGFIFDELGARHVPYKSYGEFVGASGDLGSHIVQAFVDFPENFLARPDTEKLPVFLDALGAGKLDPFTFIALQYDHTFGLEAGKPTPESMIADNDLATGRLVEAVSKSPYWSDTLILVTEDDPSGSADHVDAHRSFALVISPWARHGRVSHVRGSFPSLAATYQRALGLRPLNALDAQAAPLWDCLSGVADPTPYGALPSNVAPALNPSMPRGRAHDFSGVDRARLGLELWRHARPDAPPPRALLVEEDDDD